MQDIDRRPLRGALPAMMYPLVLVASIAIGIGQHRRVTNDSLSDIDRFRRMLAPLRKHHLESLEFSSANGPAAILRQARMALAPCLLVINDGQAATDTVLVIRPKSDSGAHASPEQLWHAEDEVYFYELKLPPGP